MYQLINNHSGRGLFRQNILQSNIFLSYINNTPTNQLQKLNKIQNSTSGSNQLFQLINNRQRSWRLLNLNYNY